MCRAYDESVDTAAKTATPDYNERYVAYTRPRTFFPRAHDARASCGNLPGELEVRCASPMFVHGRLAYGTDQGRWLMEQVQATPDGAKRRSTRPQHAFHDEDSLGATPSNSSGSDALSVRQGALSSGERAMWQQPRILLAIGAVACFLLLIFAVSR